MSLLMSSLPAFDEPRPALSKAAGDVAPQEPPAASELALLDDEQEWTAFSRPIAQQAGCWESNVLIEGMHCAACALTIEDAIRGVPGVHDVEVSSGSHRAKVVWQSQAVAPSLWMQAVHDAGYRALPANDAFARERRLAESRKALWRMMVAGLCMMQVMMYAYPAYVAQPGDLSSEMEQLLRWASWVLSLPVIFFSCGPFFSSAWRDVLHRRVSMDLPVALGMLITFLVSSAGTFDPTGIFGHEVFFDSLTMFVFFLLAGRWLELRLRDRTAGALETLMNRLPNSVLRLKSDGNFERVPVRRLQVGDVIRVLPGEAFPADGVLLQGHTSVDEALLTGESRPLTRQVGDEVISGSHNLSATDGRRLHQQTFAGPVGGHHCQAFPDRGAACCRPGLCLLVANRPRTGFDGGRVRTDRDLSLCTVSGDAGRHAVSGRCTGPARGAGAAPGCL